MDSDVRPCSIDPNFLGGNNTAAAWDVDGAMKAILEFCIDDTKKSGFVVDPADPTPPNIFSQFGNSSTFQVYRYGLGVTDHVNSIFVALPGAGAPLAAVLRQRSSRSVIVAIGAPSC